MKTTDYISAAKKKLEITSDNQMAIWLGVSRNSMSQYKTGKRVMDDYVAVKIAEALGVDPLKVIAQANEERETDKDKKEFWHRIATAAAAVLLSPFALTIANNLVNWSKNTYILC
ncbi:MAG: hypothetical protein ABW089_14790 [Sedimenticola sp.]